MLDFHPLLPMLSTRATNHFHFDVQLLFILKEGFLVLLLFWNLKKKQLKTQSADNISDLALVQTGNQPWMM